MTMTTTSLVDLAGLQTERRNPNSSNIDHVSTVDLCRIINGEDATIAAAVARCIPVIAAAIDTLADRVRGGGRVIYVGAGTSGRLGVLDASEIPPTYSAPEGQFIGLMAGGDAALRHAQEGAEDDVDAAVRDLEALDMDGRGDSLIGIAASGRTPYVLSCLSYAKKRGCVTVGVACVEPSAMSDCGHVDYMISPVVGAEVVTGSTRMKAGTATKLVLNMLSTGTMIRTGKTYGNMMVDLRATNLKLQQRSRNILRSICGSSCPQSDSELNTLLKDCGGSVKLAIATLSLGIPVVEAKQRLFEAGDVLANVLKTSVESDSLNGALTTDENDTEYVLCVDGGGSKCAAVVMSSADGDSQDMYGYGEAAGCNVTDVGVEAAITSISLAIQRAVDAHPTLRGDGGGGGVAWRPTLFSSVWIALAGRDRKDLAQILERRLETLFKRSAGASESGRLRITNDIELVASSAAQRNGVDSVVVLVAGTGSVAMSFRRDHLHQQHQQGGEGEEDHDRFIRVGRSGGWGHLLGDDGSGFDIGRQGIRRALTALDVFRNNHPRGKPSGGGAAPGKDGEMSTFQQPSFTPMVRRILDHFLPLASKTRTSNGISTARSADLCDQDPNHNDDDGVEDEYDLLSAILSSSSANPDKKTTIAQVARVVLESLPSTSGKEDAEAKEIIDEAVRNLLSLLDPLLLSSPTETQKIDPTSSIIALAGGMMQSETFVDAVKAGLMGRENGTRQIKFKDVVVVEKPALLGAKCLLTSLLRPRRGISE